jgi:hypothetical protein
MCSIHSYWNSILFYINFIKTYIRLIYQGWGHWLMTITSFIVAVSYLWLANEFINIIDDFWNPILVYRPIIVPLLILLSLLIAHNLVDLGLVLSLVKFYLLIGGTPRLSEILNASTGMNWTAIHRDGASIFLMNRRIMLVLVSHVKGISQVSSFI